MSVKKEGLRWKNKCQKEAILGSTFPHTEDIAYPHEKFQNDTSSLLLNKLIYLNKDIQITSP